MKLLTADETGALEQRAVEAGVSLDTLMANAGLAVAQEVWMQLGALEDRRIAVLVGPGNNGGDGLVAARHLAEWGAQVRCYALTTRDDAQWQATIEAGVPCGSVDDDQDYEALRGVLEGSEAIVDALLGTGHARPIEGALAEILQGLRNVRERSARPKLIAVDLPSGVDADSGRVDPAAAAADETVTFHAPKVGLYLQPGAGFAGNVQAVEIGIPTGLDDDYRTELLERRTARALLPARPVDSHKGTFGRVLVVAGSARYPGAALLAGGAAYRSGAGQVTLAAPGSLQPGLIGGMPELTHLPLVKGTENGAIGTAALPLILEQLAEFDSLVIGCGLGTADETREFVRALLADPALKALRGITIDADALNLLAGTDWAAALGAPTVVTPHPGEMGRLSGRSNDEVQANRLALARASAAQWTTTVVLKGANTIVAGPDGATRISPVATAALATAGTGDVLAGAIGGLIGQGLTPFDAASLAVYLHGDAGIRSVRGHGNAGTTASDVLAQLALAGRSLAGEEPLEGPAGGFGGGFGAGLGGEPGGKGLEGLLGQPGGLGAPEGA